MKTLKLFAAAAALALVCVSCVSGGSSASTRKSFPDNAFKERQIQLHIMHLRALHHLRLQMHLMLILYMLM